MTWAHAGLLNGGRCLRLKSPLVGWNDCAEWSKLANVVIEGGGTLDANADDWYLVWGKRKGNDDNMRPMMLDLMWVDGLTIRDLKIRRPGYWTVHPTFSNNVRVTDNSIITEGSNTDGCDPDSSWNVYIAGNTFSTGDDCIAIKAGRDWSGIMTNISTQNVLAEQNTFLKGHGVSIGSETSGWVRNVTIRDSVLDGTNLAVRIKSMRGRGGGVEDVLYQNLTGSVISAVQLTLNYHAGTPPTNATATPAMRRITIRNLKVKAHTQFLDCAGLSDSGIEDITFDDVVVTGTASQSCQYCSISADPGSTPRPKCEKAVP
jgi:polygalacturonase